MKQIRNLGNVSVSLHTAHKMKIKHRIKNSTIENKSTAITAQYQRTIPQRVFTNSSTDKINDTTHERTVSVIE